MKEKQIQIIQELVRDSHHSYFRIIYFYAYVCMHIIMFYMHVSFVV